MRLQNRLKTLSPRPFHFGAKGRFYRKSLILVLLITSLPTALIGVTLYYFGVTRIEEEMNRIHRTQVNQAIRTMDSALLQLEATTAQWAYNPIFDGSLKDYPFSYYYEKTQDLYKSLAVLRGSHPLIERVYLYLDDARAMISNEDGIESQLSGPSEAAYRQMMQSPKTMFWTDAIPSPKGDQAVALVHKLPRGNGLGLLIVYLDQMKLNRMMQEVSSENVAASFIVKEDGRPIAVLNGNERDSSGLSDAMRREAMSRTSPNESFVYEWNQREYSLSYGKFTRAGSTWTYVTATPLDQLTKPVAFLSRLVMLLSIAGLFAAFALSWFASEQLYRPIRTLAQAFRMEREPGRSEEEQDELKYIEKQWRHIHRETRQLEKQLKLQLPHLREGFLLQLLQGHLYSLSEADLRERMEQFGWELRQKGFAVIIVRLAGLSGSGKFKEGDEQLVTFSAANITGDVSAQRREFHADVINFQDLTVGLLLTFPVVKHSEQVKQALYGLSEEITRALQTLLRMESTVVIGKLCTDVASVPAAFDEARQAMKYRKLHESSQIIEAEDVLPQSGKQIEYPFELETHIIESIRTGDEEEALRRIGEFIAVLEEKTGQECLVQQGLLQLLGSIQHAFLKSGFRLPLLAEGTAGYEQLFRLREPEEMVRWLRNNVIAPYAAEMNGWRESNDQQLRLTVDQVLATLQEQYMEDISLEAYADRHGLNPYTLSKAFKQIKGVNFIDYLTELRMEKSRQLLAETDLKINDVAKQVGYQPSYFNRIFKKHAGLTPSQYRHHLRQRTV